MNWGSALVAILALIAALVKVAKENGKDIGYAKALLDAAEQSRKAIEAGLQARRDARRDAASGGLRQPDEFQRRD